MKNIKNKKLNKKPNMKVVIGSLIAFGFVWLSIFVDWIFIVGALIMIYLNQRELMGDRKKKIRKIKN
jgi:hypothetical protein